MISHSRTIYPNFSKCTVSFVTSTVHYVHKMSPGYAKLAVYTNQVHTLNTVIVSDSSRRDPEHSSRGDYITILSASAGAMVLLVSIVFLLAAVRYYLKLQG